MRHIFTILALAAILPILRAQEFTAPVLGGPDHQETTFECRVHEFSDAIIEDYLRSRAEYVEQGILEPRTASNSRQVTLFDWPLRERDGYSQFNYYHITNFVDQDTTTGVTLDYNCGTRTYDGHKGLDITLWPFWWEMMADEQVEVIAAAPGTIVQKYDGNFDMNCTCTGPWNAVYVEHADGSLALYGHLKSGSLTSKPIGSTVSTGDFLGLVGSSGCSTYPHLHFEVRDADLKVIDPFDGNCDNTNSGSWWIDDHPYTKPQINKMMTHSADPNISGWCPNDEIINASNNFMPNDNFRMGVYFMDQEKDSTTTLSLLYPDGSYLYFWNFTSPGTYSRAWWYWYGEIPADAPRGIYTFRATYNNETYEHYFTVDCPNSVVYNEAHVPEDITVHASNEISTQGPIKVKSAAGVTKFQAANGVTLNADFEVVKGANLTVQPGGCP